MPRAGRKAFTKVYRKARRHHGSVSMLMRAKKHFWCCFTIGALNAGCVLQADKPPQIAMPGAFGNAAASTSWPGQDWYHNFGSAELDRLIDTASRNNLDVSQAQARTAQADARARQAHAAILPSVDAGGAVNYLGGHSSNGWRAPGKPTGPTLVRELRSGFLGQKSRRCGCRALLRGGLARGSGYDRPDRARRRRE